MNKPKYEKIISIITTSEKEYEAFARYKLAKRDDKSWKFEFNIGKNNEVKPVILEYLT